MGNLPLGIQLVRAINAIVPQNQRNKSPFVNIAPGGILSKWRDSYERAARLVDQMSLVEKVNITTGTGWMMGSCVGNTGALPLSLSNRQKG